MGINGITVLKIFAGGLLSKILRINAAMDG
jgi:hypothetical protein